MTHKYKFPLHTYVAVARGATHKFPLHIDIAKAQPAQAVIHQIPSPIPWTQEAHQIQSHIADARCMTLKSTNFNSSHFQRLWLPRPRRMQQQLQRHHQRIQVGQSLHTAHSITTKHGHIHTYKRTKGAQTQSTRLQSPLSFSCPLRLLPSLYTLHHSLHNSRAHRLSQARHICSHHHMAQFMEMGILITHGSQGLNARISHLSATTSAHAPAQWTIQIEIATAPMERHTASQKALCRLQRGGVLEVC